MRHDVGLGDARHAMQGRPDEHGLVIDQRMEGCVVAMQAAQTVAQHVEGVHRVPDQLWMLRRLRPRRAEHQSVFKGLAVGVIQIGMPHRAEVDVRIAAARPLIKVLRKIDEAPAHDFGEQMIAANEVPVGRLVRDSQPSRDIAHAQVFNALLSDHFASGFDTSLLE